MSSAEKGTAGHSDASPMGASTGMTLRQMMHNVFRIFSPPENPVLSLEVQARMAPKPVARIDSLNVLVRHFFGRFFDNPLTSGDGENGIRVIQALSLVAVPGLMFALSLIPSYFIFPPNTAPRGYWPRVSDHYFYVMYASVVAGAAAVFEWDLLFPDMIDVLVLTPLPVERRKLFGAKIVALAWFLGIFLLASGAMGLVFLPLIAEEPGLFRHFAAHIVAVSSGGLFTAALFVSLQGVLLNVAGERVFRWMSPVLQALSLTILLIVLFLFPLLSHNLRLLLMSSSAGVMWFPPFWFLGMYQTVLEGVQTPAVFHALAARGVAALLAVAALCVVTYPLAYRRKTRAIIQGQAAWRSRGLPAGIKDAILHAVFVARPRQRAVYHFIGQTLRRAPQHRVYLSMYAGAGLALLIAATVGFEQHGGRLQIVYGEAGLRSAVPIAAFLVVSGLKVAFQSPVELKANWLFHVTGRRPDANHVAATLLWTLPRALFVVLGVLVTARLLNASAFPAMRPLFAQLLLAQGLCLLLVDLLFVRFLEAPFTIPLRYSKRNLAFSIAAFLVLFSPYIWTIVDIGRWMGRSVFHMVMAAMAMLLLHWLLRRQQNVMMAERALLSEEESEEFPQRLGLV